MTGSSGLIIPPKGYWEEITDYCRKKGIMVIADETDEAAQAKWQHYKDGIDLEAMEEVWQEVKRQEHDL